MPTIRKIIALSDTWGAWIERGIAQAAFAIGDAHIRDLVRSDHESRRSSAV